MNIGVVHQRFSNIAAGGGVQSLHCLLDCLMDEKKVDLTIYESEYQRNNQIYSSAQYHYLPEISVPIISYTKHVINNYLANRHFGKINHDNHDLIITQDSLLPAGVHFAASKNIKCICFIRSLDLAALSVYSIHESTFSQWLSARIDHKIEWPSILHTNNQYRSLLNRADMVVANSRFTQEQLWNEFEIKSRLIYPPIKIEDYLITEFTQDSIGIINPRRGKKGLDIFLKLANRMNEQKFLIAGEVKSRRIRNTIDSMSNVCHLGWIKDPREFYKQCKVIVVPSRYQEPFGRVAAEAMVSGIPVVVSDRGGLPEVVGSTGEIVTEIEDMKAWEKSIRRALENHNPEQQKQRVKNKFSADKQSQAFLKFVEELIE